MKKINHSDIYFEGKHVDEKVLHFTKPSKVQTTFEIVRIIIPSILMEFGIIGLYSYEIISSAITISLFLLILIFTVLTVTYKKYRVGKNYLIITSKRILFHGMEGFFKDYVKKISFENIRNVNYFTTSLLGKMANFGTLEIQSSHGGEGDIKVYNIEHGKMLTHYIDKVMHISQDDRNEFGEFNPDYFKEQ